MAKTATREAGPAAMAPVPTDMPGTSVAVPSDFEQMMREDAGMGVSTRAADNITPSVNVLQPLSPEVIDGPERVEDAAPGDFLLSDNEDSPIIKGKVGFWFQPVCTTEWWFEFVQRDRGGGFVARYPIRYDDNDQPIPPAGATQDPVMPFRYTFRETGNSCIHYRFIPGIMWQEGHGLEYVIPFHGTGHTVARGWNTRMNRKRTREGIIYPAFSHVYKLTTMQRKNKMGTWFSIAVGGDTMLASAQPVVGEDYVRAYEMGRSLARAFKAGDRVEGVSGGGEELAGSAPRENDDEIPF